jgi:hypothetical protein
VENMDLEITVDSCRSGFTVYANDTHGCLGYYLTQLDFDDVTILSSITTYRSGLGVARALIERAELEMGNMAKDLKKNLVHVAYLTSDRAREVLPHIFEGLGYVKQGLDENQNVVLRKEYSP